MKQVLICKTTGEYAYNANGFDATSVEDGSIAFVDNSTGEIIEDTPINNFSIVLGRPSNKQPFIIPEVDLKSLSVNISMYAPGTPFTAKFEVPQPIVGYTYTVIVAKKGVVFNERNKWTATVVASTTDPLDVAEELVRQIMASSETSGIYADVDDNSVQFASDFDYNIILADELSGVDIEINNAKPRMLDSEYVKDLASQCAAGKGFNYLSEDGKEIYPGYPENIDAEKYAMATLRFAVPRASAKTRDEVVYQLVHIVTPITGMSQSEPTGIIGDIATILADYIVVTPEP